MKVGDEKLRRRKKRIRSLAFIRRERTIQKMVR